MEKVVLVIKQRLYVDKFIGILDKTFAKELNHMEKKCVVAKGM